MDIKLTVQAENQETLDKLQRLLGTDIFGIKIKHIELLNNDNSPVEEVLNTSPNYQNVYQKDNDITQDVINRFKGSHWKYLTTTLNKNGGQIKLKLNNDCNVLAIKQRDISELPEDKIPDIPVLKQQNYKVYQILLDKPFKTDGDSLKYVIKFWKCFGIPVINYDNEGNPLFGKVHGIPMKCLGNDREILIFSPYSYDHMNSLSSQLPAGTSPDKQYTGKHSTTEEQTKAIQNIQKMLNEQIHS